MQLHEQSYKDKGKKNKKKNRNKGNTDENNGNEEATTETNNANNDNNHTGESRTTITAHMHQEDDKELNDKEFKEALLVAAQSGDNRFDMTELEDISLALVYSEESLGGAHFEVMSPEEHVDNTGIPPYLEFTIKELEEFATKDLPIQGNPEDTQEDFWAGSN